MVMRVDKEKGYIDLSKRRVAPEDIVKCNERYNQGKMIHSIMRHVAATTGRNLLQLNKDITWKLNKAPYKSTYEAFRLAVTDPDTVFGPLNVDQEVLSKILVNIRRKMTP